MAGAYWRVTLFGTGAGSNTQNVVRFRRDASIASAEVVANLVQTHFVEKARLRAQGSGFTWTGIKVEEKPDPGGEVFIKGFTIVGTASTGVLPMQCAVLWNLFVGPAGNASTGQLYWPGSPQSWNANGLVSATALTQHNALKDELTASFITGGGSSGLRWIVLSRKNDTIHEVSGIGISPVWATLRSRRLGRGF